MAFKAVAEQTDGDFSLMERTLPPSGRGPPAHRHTNCSETFFILEGTVTVELEGAAVATGPGDFVRVSRGRAHTRTSGNCTSCSRPTNRRARNRNGI
jgi:mannose-6-phosphate isomerase-like protein (cupin superfamily)